jgi:hypothetical protein
MTPDRAVRALLAVCFGTGLALFLLAVLAVWVLDFSAPLPNLP